MTLEQIKQEAVKYAVLLYFYLFEDFCNSQENIFENDNLVFEKLRIFAQNNNLDIDYVYVLFNSTIMVEVVNVQHEIRNGKVGKD